MKNQRKIVRIVALILVILMAFSVVGSVLISLIAGA